MAAQPQFSDDDSIDSTITYQEEESPHIGDAVNYVYSVKLAFGANSEDYLHFLALLKDSKDKRITTPVVVSRIKLLFSEHQELIEGFNQFLPARFRIAVPLPLSRRPDICFEQTISFVNRVKVAFSQENERYASFLQLLNGYREAEMSLLELCQKMCELLHDRQDLLVEFFDYMPRSRRETFQHAVNSAMMDGTITKMKSKPVFLLLLGVSLSVLVALGVGFAVRVGI